MRELCFYETLSCQHFEDVRELYNFFINAQRSPESRWFSPVSGDPAPVAKLNKIK